MIQIKLDDDPFKNKKKLDELAQKHWKWFKDYVEYDKLPESISNETKKQRNQELRDILGSVYDELETIIKASYDKLSDMTKDSKYQKFVVNVDDLNVWQNKYDDLEEKHIEQRKASGKKSQKRSQDLKDAEEKLQKEKEKVSQQKEQLAKKLVSLLGYDDFSRSTGDWGAKALCSEELKINVCPYCNRQYIYVTKAQGNKWTSSMQMDHFFPKEHFPLFSCSFYNLIPSCYACNHGKGENLRKTIYPYKEEFGKDGAFNICLIKNGKKLEDLNLQEDIEVCISVNGRVDKQTLIKNSDRVFHLTAYYNAHQTDLKDFLLRYQYYTGAKLDELKELKLIGEGKLTPANGDLQRDFVLGLPLMTEKIDFPLRKFKEDIFEQLENAKKKM